MTPDYSGFGWREALRWMIKFRGLLPLSMMSVPILSDEGEGRMATRVEVNTPAPEIDMQDYRGKRFQLSALKGKKRTLLVFNRGFL
jgi:hypothetical protein